VSVADVSPLTTDRGCYILPVSIALPTDALGARQTERMLRVSAFHANTYLAHRTSVLLIV
jgi:hypothetical protein